MKRLLLALAVAALLYSCPNASDSLGPGGGDTYSLTITCTYTGATTLADLDEDGAADDEILNTYVYIKGDPEDFSSLVSSEKQGFAQTSWEWTFPAVAFSPCYILAFYDADYNGTLNTGDPYVIYDSTSDISSATGITLDADNDTPVTITFDDSRIWQ